MSINKKKVFITGVNGDIGAAVAKSFYLEGWHVVGTDIHENHNEFCHEYIQLDLSSFVERGLTSQQKYFFDLVKSDNLNCLINNAAYQYVCPIKDIDIGKWQKSLNVNLTAPLLLCKEFYSSLIDAQGNVINIHTIHSKLTKKNFAAYASSKSSFESLSRAMALEFGSIIKVNGIRLAAIKTSMLSEGFSNDIEKLNALDELHPAGQVGSPNDVADVCLFLAKNEIAFLHGSIVDMDGGISYCLKDVDK